jgi:hypothetical protein
MPARFVRPGLIAQLADEEERRRRAPAERLAAGMGGVEQGLYTALRAAQAAEDRQGAMQRQQREEARQTMLDKLRLDESALNEQYTKLRMKQIANNERRIEDDRARTAKLDDERMAKEARAQSIEDEKVRRERAAVVVRDAVAAAIASGENPRDLAERLRDFEDTHDVPTSAVVAEYNRQIEERGEKGRKADLEERRMRLAEEGARRRGAGGGASAKEKRDPVEEKKKQQALEVENFVANINDNIEALERQIKDTGTFELFGPESADLERRITAIAVDMAKLADPGSVAREGEVATMKRGLFPTSGTGALFTRNATALQTLAHLKAEVEKRRRNAYRVRGLEAPEVEGGERSVPPAPVADVRVEDIERW